MIPGVELSTQSATLVSALLGGTLGAAGTYVAQAKLQSRRDEKRTEWLRGVLLAELESMDALEAWEGNPDDPGLPLGNWLHNQVFESVSNELGRLESDEVKALVTFHGRAQHTRSSHQRLMQEGIWNDIVAESVDWEMEYIQRHRRAAMHLLSQNMGADIK